MRKASRKIKRFCRENSDRKGIKDGIVKSNISDNDSAKMKILHGTVQGFNGLAAADDKHPVILPAEAFGQGPENNLLHQWLN